MNKADDAAIDCRALCSDRRIVLAFPSAKAYEIPKPIETNRDGELKRETMKTIVRDRCGWIAVWSTTVTFLFSGGWCPAFAEGMNIAKDLLPTDGRVNIMTNMLAEGSLQALQRQEETSRASRLPIEVQTKVTGIPLRLIPPGTLTANRSDIGEYTLSLENPLYMGKFEITQSNWMQVMGTNPACFRDGGSNHPVEQVNWYDAQEFLQRLCQLEGVKPGVYRLPTDSEWEYACRAGTLGRTYDRADVYDGFHERFRKANDRIGWFELNAIPGEDPNLLRDRDTDVLSGGDSGGNERVLKYGRTHPVGLKMCNAYGLFDTLGNVEEWIQEVQTNRPHWGWGTIRGDHWAGLRFCVWPRCTVPLSERSRTIGLRIVRTLGEKDN